MCGHATARILQVSPVAEFLAVATKWFVPVFGVITFEMLKEPSEIVPHFLDTPSTYCPLP